MTAIPNTPRQQSPLRMILIVALAAFAFGALLAVLNTPQGRVMTTSHAVERHGDEAVEIRQCLRQNGAMQVWQSDKDPCVYYFVTQLKCGRLGVLIAQVWPSIVDGCDFRERSAYSPRDGSPSRVMDYLRQFSRRID